MHRRTHKKSRGGCLDCKRRHVKCDESRPKCVQCATSQLCCSYMTESSSPASIPLCHTQSGPKTPQGASPSLSPPRSDAVDHLTPPPAASSSITLTIQDLVNVQESDPFAVNMLHLRLMHQFSTETSKTIAFDQKDQHRSYQATLEAALSAPYLMHEILAVTALHLSILLPAQQGYYHHQASGLQTRALSLFNSSRLEVDAGNCIPIVIFSSLLAIHSLCDVVRFRNNDFSTFLDDFIGCLNLHRGVRSVTSHSWHLLQETHLRPVLDAGEALGQTTGLIGKECDGLQALLNSADIGQVSTKAYQSTIDHLQKAFDMERISGGHTDAFIVWPVLVPTGYIDLLIKRSPEALVILAHYAALLHNHRDLWFIGDAGLYLIDSITRHLGVYWDAWLAWPNAIIHGRPPQVLQAQGADWGNPTRNFN